ncbi:MAG: flagellar hook-basal body complex protein, partial [Rhodospirillales bacterium]|nr:flagellar hook-basal body complex protein [Rhodospirillales bacterium]
MTLSAFTISTLGMRAQATGLNVIGTNVSNLQTGGYKRADAHFQTMVSETMFEQSDTGGVRPKILQRNSVQGTLLPTGSAMDLAIIGDGFYVTRATFDSSGELLYTRDGAFEKSVLNPITTTDPNTGDIINTKDAWLVDKNGNYVLGFAVNADGTFPTSGTPAPMRVDQNAFIDLGTASTSAELGLNLDSNADVVNYPHVTAVSNYDNAGLRPDGMEVLTIDFVDSNGDRQEARLNFTKTASNIWDMSATYEGSGTAQINTITVDGVVDIGDTYDVTVNGQTASYTVATGDTQADIVSGLIAALNADPLVAADVTASTGTDAGTLFLTSTAVNTVFTSTASSTNGPNIAQVSSVALTGALEVGDVYNLNIGGTSFSRTVVGSDTTLNDVAASMIATINATPALNAQVTASAGGAGEIVLTAVTAGSIVTVSPSVTDRGQTDVLTLTGTLEAGDIYTATVDGTPVSYTVAGGDTLAIVRDGLAAAINANGTTNLVVNAEAGATPGELVLYTTTPGNTFTATGSTTNGGLNPDNAITAITAPNGLASAMASTTTTAALTTTADNTATSTIRVAAQATLQSTPVTTLTFSGDGEVVQESLITPGTFTEPDPVTLNFSFPATSTDPVGTATFDLDVTGLSQFATGFLFQRYSEDGFEA